MSVHSPGTTCDFTKLACDPSCSCDPCKEFRLSIRMTDKSQTLYCRAFTFLDVRTGKWIGEREYTHAASIEDARLTFWRSENEKTMRRINVVGVAPVIGYFVNDTKGDELSV